MKFLSIFYHFKIITRTNYTGYLVHVFKYLLHLTLHHATEYCVSMLHQKPDKIYNSTIPNIFFTSPYENVTHRMLSNVTGNTLCVTKLHYDFLLEARTKRNMLNLFHVCKYTVYYIKIRGRSYVWNLVKDRERLLRGKLNIATFIFLQFHFLYKCNDTSKKMQMHSFFMESHVFLFVSILWNTLREKLLASYV